MLLVSACTGQQAIDAYCDYHVEAMDMYARKYKLNFVQVMQTPQSRRPSSYLMPLLRQTLTPSFIRHGRFAATWIQRGSTPGSRWSCFACFLKRTLLSCGSTRTLCFATWNGTFMPSCQNILRRMLTCSLPMTWYALVTCPLRGKSWLHLFRVFPAIFGTGWRDVTPH